MKGTLQQRVRETIERHRMLRPGDTVGVGVSGGPDSVALLLLLEELRSEWGLRLLILHFNHRLRGPDSEADEQFVARLAAERGIECVSAREDVAAQARQQGWNLEDAARRLRYRFFSGVVDSGRATRIAVAHTADDQAETVLAHLLRGTGPTGLAAIYPVAGHVVRPLLEVRRQDLLGYLAQRGQSWREDLTNLDTTRLRARIRHELLSRLEADFHPAVVAHLSQLAKLAREDEVFWCALVENRFQALVERSARSLSVRIPDLLSPLVLVPSAAPSPDIYAALSKRLVRRIVAGLEGHRGQLTAQHVEQVLYLATACESGHRVQLPGGVEVERSFDRLIFALPEQTTYSPEPQGTARKGLSYEYVVELPEEGVATISVPEIGRRFRLKVVDWPPGPSDTRGETKALDRELLRAPLVLRNWRPGDSYRPHGRRRVRKLKQLLLEQRIAVRERTAWPVLTSAGRLVWARGFPVADDVAPQATTKVGVLIAEEEL